MWRALISFYAAIATALLSSQTEPGAAPAGGVVTPAARTPEIGTRSPMLVRFHGPTTLLV